MARNPAFVCNSSFTIINFAFVQPPPRFFFFFCLYNCRSGLFVILCAGYIFFMHSEPRYSLVFTSVSSSSRRRWSFDLVPFHEFFFPSKRQHTFLRFGSPLPTPHPFFLLWSYDAIAMYESDFLK